MATWIPHALRWSARTSGLLLVGMVLIFLVGEGPPNPFRQPPSVQVEFLGMILMVAGFLAGWRWEALGGLLAVTGFAAFAATEVIVNHSPPGGAIPLFAVPGLLFLLSYGAGKVRRRSVSS
jgi:peptidoglycan/LPS O-acetylase OafA/YrhL